MLWARVWKNEKWNMLLSFLVHLSMLFPLFLSLRIPMKTRSCRVRQSDSNITLFGQHHNEKFLACPVTKECTRLMLVYAHVILNPFLVCFKRTMISYWFTKLYLSSRDHGSCLATEFTLPESGCYSAFAQSK